ncbi:hypothetical protein XENOCAPTIV_007114 [Xenoophorus captivus]|uniref:Uncharacterized protein n=1 Tax=Xenoophorus captivus TaxID=1517983 RepID=A0ABV0RPB5_9TELE
MHKQTLSENNNCGSQTLKKATSFNQNATEYLHSCAQVSFVLLCWMTFTSFNKFCVLTIISLFDETVFLSPPSLLSIPDWDKHRNYISIALKFPLAEQSTLSSHTSRMRSQE